MTKKTSTKGNPDLGELTAERLRHVLDYNEETGIFRWRVTGRGIAKSGAVAGSTSDSGRGKVYTRIRIDMKLYYAHRLAWLYVHGVWPPDQIDHVDGNGLNNSILNLRRSSQTQNLGNTKLRATGKEKYKGITRKDTGWVAQIVCAGKHEYLGIFKDPEEAAMAYDKAANDKFGEFAKTNKSMGLI